MVNYTQTQRIDALRLIRTPKIGPITYYQLIKNYGDASKAIEALPELAKRGGGKKPFIPLSKQKAEKELEQLTKYGGNILLQGEDNYPTMLGHIPDAPPVLSYVGHIHLLNTPSIAIVGARNASAVGLKITEKIAEGLSNSKFTIVSGMARGVDATAHWQALTNGTIAILAGGIDNIYPPENTKLYERLREEGLILAESPFGTKPLNNHFPRRNRIISALSLAVIVTEAALRSGSLITARMAAEQGREVMAVPASPLDPRGKGTNSLIKNGATLIETVSDALNTLQPLTQQNMYLEEETEDNIYCHNFHNPNPKDRDTILSLLSPTPIPLDYIIERSGISVPIINLILIELELAGRLERNNGHGISLIYEKDGILL